MNKKSTLAKNIDEKLSQRKSIKVPVTLSLNKLNYNLLQEHCTEFNRKIDSGKVAGKKLNVSLIVDELIYQYLLGKN